MVVFDLQIFTNGDKAHAAQVLNKLSLEDCFEGVICFETLNPPPLKPGHDDYNTQGGVVKKQEGIDEKQVLAEGELEGTATDDTTNSNRISSKSPILCKPSVEAIEAAIRIAKADPKKTVNDKADASHLGYARLLLAIIHGYLCLFLLTDFL